MNPHTFLRTLLLLPILIPLVAMASGSKSALAFVLTMSLVLGGVPYLVTAALLWFRIARCQSKNSAIWLIFSVPLIFAALQMVAWSLWGLFQPPEPDGLAMQLALNLLAGLGLALQGLVIGYLYAIVWVILFLVFTRLGLVSGFTGAAPPSASAKAA